MLFVFFAALSILFVAEAAIYRQEYENPSIKLRIGSPSQGPFTFNWTLPLMRRVPEGPIISDKNFGGLFDYNASRTFRRSNSDRFFVYGYDLVTPRDGTPTNMTVMVNRGDDKFGSVDLSPGMAGSVSFMHSMFWSLRTSVLVFLIRSTGDQHSGTIIIGEEKPTECYYWTNYLAMKPSAYVLPFASRQIEIGKYHRNAIVATTISLEDLALDKETHTAAVKYLNVVNGKIDCQEKTEIAITTADRVFRIRPQDYMKKMGNNVCEFGVAVDEYDTIRLPLRLLGQHCISYNFGKNLFGIGNLKY